jgi:hypothetical protein
MYIPRYLSIFVGAALLFTAGCSVFPGLRVLGGEDPNAIAGNNSVVELSDLVMADKTDSTNPSLMAAADRIEAASFGEVDIIEIREDDADDAFIVNLMFRPPATADQNTPQGQFELYNSLRRAMEVSWQATMAESEGYDTLRITLIQPQSIPTLDNGDSFVGFITGNAEIARSDAIAYLGGQRDLNTFFDLIANGTMVYENVNGDLYLGSPNHPMFMLPTTQGVAGASSSDSGEEAQQQ